VEDANCRTAACISLSIYLVLRPLVSRSSTSFPEDYFVNYRIGAYDILRFRALYSYNNGTVWDSIRFLSVPVHYSYYLLFRGLCCYISRTNSIVGNRFFDPSMQPFGGGLGGQ